VAVCSVLTAAPRVAVSQAQYTEQGGTLPDGTVYLMRVPTDWNRTLIRDLDYAGAANNARNMYWLRRGYAVAGTRRHRLRAFQYDPAREIANLNTVLDLFEARFGKSSRVIQYGCSGGGHVALAVAEDFADRVHGVIATAAHTPVWIMNTYLDGWFTLKALLAPDLVIVDLPLDQTYGGSGHGVTGTIPTAWRQAIDAAQQTAEGRARIALAFTIGQWPAWVNRLTPQPDLDDVVALQHSMYHALYQNASNPGGEARILFESAANGQQLSWNTGLDYRELFDNGNASFKQAVRQLYREAGLDLAADLAKVNAFPRVSASPHALDFWSKPGRTVKGDPKVPVLRLHEIGDYQVPLSLVQGYDDQVRVHGKDALYRTAFVQAPGHCGFSVAESAAAMETMIRRLDMGVWGSTAPTELNRLAASLDSSPARFTSIEQLKQVKYNRVWIPQ
jgi:alpha-beta hydrolase superfamily lysophospholipase